MDWKHLESIEDLNQAIEESGTKRVVIYKHSTRCSVSVMVKRVLESQWSHGSDITPYYLDLLSHRDVSNEIASRFNIEHESPQIVVLENGEAIHHASHTNIDQANFAA